MNKNCINDTKNNQEQILNIFSRFSHDVKNMLTTLYSCYQLEEMRFPALKSHELWQNLRSTILGMNSYIDRVSLLRYSYTVNPTTFSLGELIFSLPDLCDERFGNESRSFCFDLPQTPMTVCADRNTISCALMELLANCYEATKNNDTIKITVSEEKNSFDISVADSGCGMDSAALDSMFTPFKTQKPKHLGIGLTIAQNVIMAHHGSIKVEPLKNGTTVHIKLPAAQP